MRNSNIDKTIEYKSNNNSITLTYPFYFYDPKNEIYKGNLYVNLFDMKTNLFFGVAKNITKSAERQEFTKFGFEYKCNFNVPENNFFVLEYFDNEAIEDIDRYKILDNGDFEATINNTINKSFEIIIRKLKTEMKV